MGKWEHRISLYGFSEPDYHYHEYWTDSNNGYGRLFGGTPFGDSYQSAIYPGIFATIRGVHGNDADCELRTEVGSIALDYHNWFHADMKTGNRSDTETRSGLFCAVAAYPNYTYSDGYVDEGSPYD